MYIFYCNYSDDFDQIKIDSFEFTSFPTIQEIRNTAIEAHPTWKLLSWWQ